MRFGAKIGLVLLGVGVLPVALAGAVAYSAARGELEHTVGAMQARGAEDLALHVERFVASAQEALRLSAGPFRSPDAFAPAELTRLLALPYRQLPFVSIIAVVDDQRRPVAGPVSVRRPEGDPDLAGRPPVSDEDLERFARRLPIAPAADGALRASAPYRGLRGPVRVAVTLRLGKNRALAAELVLAEVEARVRELSGPDAVAWLVDEEGELIVHGEAEPSLVADEHTLARDGLRDASPASRVVRRSDGRTWLESFAPVAAPRWGVVLARPIESAFAAAEVVRRRIVAGAVGAILLALLFGWVVTRRVTRRVERLSQATGAIAQGDFAAAPVEVAGDDEIAALGRSFVRMTGELRRRDEEIRAFNLDLQRRVEERTAELHAAQDQIQRTRRLAALGSLGAGLAHELNNPMTAVTGYLAILARQLGTSEHGELIRRASDQAARISRVVDDLRAFADPDRVGGSRFSLVGPVEAALDLYRPRLQAARIEVRTRFEEPLPETRGDPTKIQEVVAHLLDNALHAMPAGGSLEVSLGAVGASDGEALRLTVADSGKGIPPGLRERIFDPFFTVKDGRSGRVGMGLSVSHRIVEAHHGRIFVESRDGPGAAVTVLLPAAAEPHLQ